MQINKTLQAFTARNVVQINTNKDIIKCCPYSELATHSESIKSSHVLDTTLKCCAPLNSFSLVGVFT